MASITGASAGAAGVAKAPKKVTGVSASPGVGTITISWKLDAGSGVTYTVSSTPVGKGCEVIDLASCTVPATTSTPWRFTVTASDALGTSTPSAPTRGVPHRILLVVTGQSNALGATSFPIDPTTGIDYLARPYRNEADTRSLITWPGWWELAPPVTPSGLVPLDTPQYLNLSTPPVQIFGPELGLARQIWSDTRQAVTIDKVVFSNSSVVQWSPNSPSCIYAGMIWIVKQTMARDATAGQLDTIGAFYWYQGESDAGDPTLYPSYQANLTAFIADVRSDLPTDATAPVVLSKMSISQLISYEIATGICASPGCASLISGDTAVRAADDWAAANLSHVLTVDTLGLPRTKASAYIHLPNVGELQLGQKLAAASEHLFP